MPLSQQDEFGVFDRTIANRVKNEVSMPLSQQDEFGVPLVGEEYYTKQGSQCRSRSKMNSE